MQGVFITGTGTEVGKTYVGVKIARQLRQLDISVIPRKPIESGCRKENDKLIPLDACALKAAANYQGALSEVCPYRFEPPISPVRAAHLANKVLTTEQLVSICMKGSEAGFLLVEGAGGFYSPLAENGLNADLAVALQLPIVLVAEDKIGVLSQVLLNAEAIQMRGLQLSGVVLNATSDQQSEYMDNAADLRERLNCSIYKLPYNKDDTRPPDELSNKLITDLINQQGNKKVRMVG